MKFSFFRIFAYEIAYEEFVYAILENITICLLLKLLRAHSLTFLHMYYA